MNDVIIRKIICGPAHSLLLSSDGDIYAFGWNRSGEVGNRTRDEQRFPIKLKFNNNLNNLKFIDIASHPYYPISMSQSIVGIYYVWGMSKGKYILSPQSTRYEPFVDILISNNIVDNTN